MNYDYCIIKRLFVCEYQIIVYVRHIPILHIDLPLTKLLYAFCNQY